VTDNNIKIEKILRDSKTNQEIDLKNPEDKEYLKNNLIAHYVNLLKKLNI
jgi:hypothetical protein